MPSISVIVRSYNYGHFISDALESIIAQTAPDWECIVVDDGSTDDTGEVVQRFLGDGRIRYLFQENAGVSAALNAGIRQATGDFVHFLDADDALSPKKFELHLRHFERKPNIDISYATPRYFVETPESRLYRSLELDDQDWMPRLREASGASLLAAQLQNNIMPISSPLVRRTLMTRVGFADESLPLLEDWDYWLRCAFEGCVIDFLEDERAQTLIRVHPTSQSSGKSDMIAWELPFRTRLAGVLEQQESISRQDKTRLLELNRRRMFSAAKDCVVSEGLLSKKSFACARPFGARGLARIYAGACWRWLRKS